MFCSTKCLRPFVTNNQSQFPINQFTEFGFDSVKKEIVKGSKLDNFLQPMSYSHSSVEEADVIFFSHDDKIYLQQEKIYKVGNFSFSISFLYLLLGRLDGSPCFLLLLQMPISQSPGI